MKKLFITTLLLISSTTFATESKKLACTIEGVSNMDINIYTTAEKNQTIEVVMTSEDVDAASRVFTNSGFTEMAISKSLSEGSFQAIVSKSDLSQVYGGAFDDAGIIIMKKSSDAGSYDVTFAAETSVYKASCKE